MTLLDRQGGRKDAPISGCGAWLLLAAATDRRLQPRSLFSIALLIYPQARTAIMGNSGDKKHKHKKRSRDEKEEEEEAAAVAAQGKEHKKRKVGVCVC